MSREGCVDGQLTTTLYASPVPWIGLYIAGGTVVCFFCMTFDMVYGLIQRKPFLPCKLFPMNAITMTMLAVATKIPVDLTTSMPRAEDQLSKLTATALTCTAIGFYMPSLGTMGTSERYGNLMALSVPVIAMVVNVCIQLRTGVIFAFIVEHIIIMVCILVLLLLMWSSAIAFSNQKKHAYKNKIGEGEGLEWLRKSLVRIQEINHISNPQTLLCITTHHHAFGILCAVSCSLVLQAMLRLFVLKNMKSYCSGESDYKWSIPIVIVIQFLTIAVGTFSIIYRWFSFVWHSGADGLVDSVPIYPEEELVDLKEKPISLKFLGKQLSNMLVVVKDLIIDAIIDTQTMSYLCTRLFFGIPFCVVWKLLFVMIRWPHTCYESGEFSDFLRSIFKRREDDPLTEWLSSRALKDMTRWRNACVRRDHPTNLIKLISEWRTASTSTDEPPFETGCCHFVHQFEARATDYLKRLSDDKIVHEYRISCMSLLVLSAITEELMPSSCPSKESLMKSLRESFEIVYFIEQKSIHISNVFDQGRLLAAKQVWVKWDESNHWFQDEIDCPAFKNKSEESESQELDSRGILRDARSYLYQRYGHAENLYRLTRSSHFKRRNFIIAEFLVLSNIIHEMEIEQDGDLWSYVENCFVRMLGYMLTRLPLAILKEIDQDDPTEIGERRVKKALKFFFELELLKGTIEWTWRKEDDGKSKANEAQYSDSPFVLPSQMSPTFLSPPSQGGTAQIQMSSPSVSLPLCVSDVQECTVSDVIDDNVVSGHAVVDEVEEKGDNDTIKEIGGSDEIV